MFSQGIELLKDTARAAFWQAWDTVPVLSEGLVYTQTSTSDQEVYAWFGYAPSVREMSGTRAAQPIPEMTWTVKNKMWEATVAMNYMTWKFNKNGAAAQLGIETGKKARQHRDKLMSATLIANATATACYDTQFFFDTDHSDPGAAFTTSQSNDLTFAAATGTVPTDVEMADAVLKAITQLMSFKDGAGDPVTVGAVKPGQLQIHCGAGSDGTLYGKLLKVATTNLLTGGAGNPVQGMFTPVFNPYLTAADEIFAFNTGSSRKPFILQVAEDVSFEDNFGDEHEKLNKDRWFGSFGCYNMAYGDWRMACYLAFT